MGAFMRKKTTCSVCRGTRLEEVLDLPGFPLTQIYVASRDLDHQGFDQGFNICADCGHGQNRNMIDPATVYDNTYTHRGGESVMATGGNDFFLNFIDSVTEGRTFSRALDVGCSDLYLTRRIAHKAKETFGVDPVWIGKEAPETEENVNVIGAFVEDLDFAAQLGGAPDLVVSAHTFEHVDEPRDQLERLIDAADDGALFIVEIPCLDTMLRLSRFDQVFHQHVNLFSVASFRRLIHELGATYVDHVFNWNYWGGTMMTAFVKGGSGEFVEPAGHPKPTLAKAKARYEVFRRQLSELNSHIEAVSDRPIFGYGGAGMLPTLAYHMESDLSYLTNILDDDPNRAGLTWPDLGVGIRQPGESEDFSEASVVITALDSARPIIRRCIDLNFREILLPLQAI
jgi:SAM-dependent methyltransferase